MSEETRILWSGLTGKVGQEAMIAVHVVCDVAIVAGMSRHSVIDFVSAHGNLFEDVEWMTYDRNEICKTCIMKEQRVNVMVDFSHPDSFEQVVDLAVRTHVPLISGTSGLSGRQMAMLYDATNRIPVFRGGNFRFKVKKLIDDAVELAKKKPSSKFYLYENFYKGKSLPSETSRVIQRRVNEATGRTVDVYSSDDFDAGNLICDWEFQARHRIPSKGLYQEKAHCRTIGFDELAYDVLEIAKVMKNKPVKKGDFYDLDEIWDDIPWKVKPAF